MRYLIRLLAAVAAAIICLSPLALATSAHADGPNPDLNNVRQQIADQADDSAGYALNGAVVVPEPDQAYAREGGVIAPEPTPVTPAPTDTGVDAATVTLLSLMGAAVLGMGILSAVVVRRQHHLAHPA